MKRIVYSLIDSCDKCPYFRMSVEDKMVFRCLHSDMTTYDAETLDDWFVNKCKMRSDETVEEDLIHGAECM